MMIAARKLVQQTMIATEWMIDRAPFVTRRIDRTAAWSLTAYAMH